MSKCQNVKMSKCQIVKMSNAQLISSLSTVIILKCQNVKMSKCQIVKMPNAQLIRSLSTVIILNGGLASNANLKLVQSSLSVRMYQFFTQISTFACICNIYNFSEPMLKALACWVDTRLTFSSKYLSSTFAHVPHISQCMSFSNYNFYLVSHIHHTSIFSYIHQYPFSNIQEYLPIFTGILILHNYI